jgi:hypothetical protein
MTESFMLCISHQNYEGDKIKKDEMGVPRPSHGEEVRSVLVIDGET